MSSKMKVILAGDNLDFPKGSAATNRAKEIGFALAELGYSPIMVPLWLSEQIDGEVCGEYFGIEYRYLFKKRNLLSGSSTGIKGSLVRFIYPIAAAVALLNYIAKKNSLRFIFLLTSKPIVIFILSVGAAIMGVKLIYDIVEEPLSAVIFKKREIDNFNDFFYYYSQIFGIFFLYLFILRLPTMLCCITENQKRYLKKWLYKENSIFILPVVKYLNKNDANHKERSKTASTCRNILYSGQLSFEKDGIDNILYAFKEVVNRTEEVRLDIFGYGSDLEVNKVQELVEELKLQKHANFHGFVSRPKLVKAQNEATMLIFLKNSTRQNRYNFPTKLIDYLSAAKPIVMSDIETHRVYFEDGRNALLVNPKDYQQIAKKIIWILDNPSQAERIAIRAYQTLKQEFSAVENISKLVAFGNL